MNHWTWCHPAIPPRGFSMYSPCRKFEDICWENKTVVNYHLITLFLYIPLDAHFYLEIYSCNLNDRWLNLFLLNFAADMNNVFYWYEIGLVNKPKKFTKTNINLMYSLNSKQSVCAYVGLIKILLNPVWKWNQAKGKAEFTLQLGG